MAFVYCDPLVLIGLQQLLPMCFKPCTILLCRLELLYKLLLFRICFGHFNARPGPLSLCSSDLWGFLWLRQGLWINDQHSFFGFGAHYLDLFSDDRMLAHEDFQGF